IEENFNRQPTLKEIADSIHLSEFHFQRLFSRWVGISPKRFLQYVTKEYAKRLLNESKNILEVSFESGLSSPGRLHDLFVNCEAVTPGEFKNQGEGLTIEYAIQPTLFGNCLLALTQRGVCGLSFIRNGTADQQIKELQKRWRMASFQENVKKTTPIFRQLFAATTQQRKHAVNLYLKGTNFQIKVWEALLKIPSGFAVSYQDLAAQIGQPKAVRAVANAVAANPIPYIIPCHRVIRKTGDFGGYQGGTARKKALLGWEAANRP
ncbi:MAG: methylated-DNA--[protein]-cysteine S-methyltransferase, partial [bacterium]